MLRPVRFESEFVSPRMGIRFVRQPGEITVFYPDGRPFMSFEELDAERLEAEKRAAQLQAENEEAQKRIDRLRAENEEAQRQAERLRAENEEANRRAARILELSRKARKGQATPEELEELDRLEESR